jgi:hypothetical protein
VAGLETWAAAIDDAERAKAVAASGVITAVDDRLITEPFPLVMADRIQDVMDAAHQIDGPLPWRNPTALPTWDDGTDPAPFIEAWPSAPATRWGLRFGLDEELGGADPRWVVETLYGPGVGAGGVFVDLPLRAARPPAPWRFPLRVGALDTDVYDAVRARLDAERGWLGDLVRPLLLGPQGVACDLLVLPGTIAEAMQLIRAAGEVRAGLPLLFSAAPAWDPAAIEALRAAAGSEAAAFVGSGDPLNLIVSLVVELSHDGPLDWALAVVTDRSPGALLAAPADMIRALRTRRRAKALSTALEQVTDVVTRGGSSRDASYGAVAGELDRLVREAPFDHESGDASRLAEIEAAAVDAVTEAGPERWVQARLFAGRGDARTPVAAFRPATTHEIDVRIGHYEAGWMSAGTPFPVDTLEAEGPFELTVVLTEPHLLSAPRRARIVLPLVGASTTATLTLSTDADTSFVDARVIVLHRNRVVQTCRLRGDVGADGGQVSLDESDVADAEAVVRPSVAGMDDRRTFAMALVVNRNEDGVARATAIGTDVVGQVDLDDVAEAVTLIRERLGEIVDSEEDFTGLDAEGTRELLVFLATHGSLLRSALEDFLPEELSAQPFLQIVSAKPDAYLPIEFAYDFPAPNPDAELCPEAPQALAETEFPDGCPGTHEETTVCPFGFWSVSKVIERHAFEPATDIPREFQVRASPTRDRDTIPLGPAVLFAASDRVDAITAGTVDRVKQSLTGSSGDPDPFAVSWESWQSLVASDKRPALLVVMSHTIRDETTDTFGLEIGAHDAVLAAQLDKRFVPPKDRPVVVALLGCETAASGRVGWERFPARFRRAGAEVIVGTLTEVLGRHAATVGEALVDALYTIPEGTPIAVGEVMVGVRRRLLAAGLPMVLALAVFGDADWLLAKEQA